MSLSTENKGKSLADGAPQYWSLEDIIFTSFSSGLAGTTLVYKVAGALADRGADVDEVYSLANWVAGRLATIGVSLGHTHVRHLFQCSSRQGLKRYANIVLKRFLEREHPKWTFLLQELR
jgi:hypothetical protein